MLTKQEILSGKGARAESRRVREPRGTALPCGSESRFHGDGISLRVVLASHSDSGSLLVVHACSAKMDAREKDSGRWLDTWCLLLTFPELFRLVEAY